MRTLSLVACALHFTAVFLTSGVALCVGADGHASYEWVEDACCGEEAAAAPAPPQVESCCEACAPSPIEQLSAAPDCGGCLDGLAPLTSGMDLDLNPLSPAPAEVACADPGVVTAEESFAAVGLALGGPPMPLPLRC